MENKLCFWEKFENYAAFFKNGVTEEAIDAAIKYAKIRQYGYINHLIELKYYEGMAPYVYQAYQNIKYFRAQAWNMTGLSSKDHIMQYPLTKKDCYEKI